MMINENVVITHTDPKSPISEAYRVLRTNIQYSSVDKPLKSIVVTSSKPMEGKTTTVVNLAVAFAQAGKRVLLIDADLRKPKIHGIFMMSNKTGLTNLIAAHDDYTKYIRLCEIPNLEILPCGTIPPNPSELLSSNSFLQFMHDMSDVYDIILLDAPPVGNITDAAIISAIVDGTILVVSSGHVEIEALKRSKELLSNVNANILGVVLNNLDKHAGSNYYYYQYDYYDEDGNKKSKRKKKRGIQDEGNIED